MASNASTANQMVNHLVNHLVKCVQPALSGLESTAGSGSELKTVGLVTENARVPKVLKAHVMKGLNVNINRNYRSDILHTHM